MATKDCVARILDASQGALSEDDIADLVDDIAKRAERRRREHPTESREANLTAVAKKMIAEEELAAQIEKRNRAINILKRKSRFARYDAMLGKEALAISSLNVGSERGFEGAALSVDALKMGFEDALVGPMIHELRQAGLLDILAKRTPDFDRDVAIELWRVSDGSAPGSGNKAAQRAAEIIAKVQEAGRQMQNQRGAFIRKVPGWIVRQTHDAVAIADAQFPRWRDAILPRLDERTFDGVEDRDAFLQHAFDNIVKGIHNKQLGADSWLGGFKGYSNRAKKVSAERVLHFKSADDWFAYNQEFGSRSVLQAVVNGLQAAARNSALMDVWGTNPEAAFRADLDQLRARTSTTPEQEKKLRDWRISAEFRQVNGTADADGLPSRARFHANVRAVITMSKLGGVVLSSFPDLAIQASALRHNGVTYFDGLANGFASLMRGKGDKEQRAIADLLNAGTQGTIGTVFDRFGVNEAMGGTMSRLMRGFFKANLLQPWTDAHKTGIGLMMSRALANHQKATFDKLPELLRISLRRYGITEREWAVYQQLDTKLASGARYLTADAVEDLPDDAIKAYAGTETKGSVARVRSDLQVKLNSYFASEIRAAMTEPGARERTLLTLGTSAGTVEGQAIRYFTQFKTFGLTFATRHIAREFLRSGHLDKTGLMALIVGTTSLGYLSMTVKEWVKGKNPRTVEDLGGAAQVVGAAMAQGGGLGIYGDLLFGEYNRFGQGALATVGGPAVGMAEDFFRTLSDTKDWLTGERKADPAAKITRLVVDNTPFLNLFYTKLAMDQLILFKIQEAMNPGFLRRTEQRVKQQNNQSYWLPPSSAVR